MNVKKRSGALGDLINIREEINMSISKVVVFRAGNEEYGLPIEHVISIEKFEHINVIPNMLFT